MPAMNTIPSIFNERKVPHTIIGGTVKKSDDDGSPLTVVLLNRGGRYYRSAVFQNLENSGFKSVISIEMANEPYDIENLSQRFPSVKFLIPLEPVSVGEMINLAVAESQCELILVMWNDMRITPSSIPHRYVSRLRENPLLCLAPVLTGEKMEGLPVQMVPGLEKRRLNIEPMACHKDNSPTIYPFDFTGIYNRDLFIKVGGFDYSITNPYWQNLDFGFRSHLWGEKIAVSTGFRLSYETTVPREDITPDRSYFTFYLKNVAPAFRRDEAVLPLGAFVAYAANSGQNFFSALRTFGSVRKWVTLNRFRFKRDALSLTAEWEPDL